MAEQVADGRPEVQIRSRALTVPGLGGPSPIQHEVACVWCPWSSSTPDVRDAVTTANVHEMSLSHTYAREEAIKEGRKHRELWD